MVDVFEYLGHIENWGLLFFSLRELWDAVSSCFCEAWDVIVVRVVVWDILIQSGRMLKISTRLGESFTNILDDFL